MTGASVSRSYEDTDTHREDGHVKTEAETRVTQLKAKDIKDCQLSPEARTEVRNRSSLKPLKAAWPY